MAGRRPGSHGWLGQLDVADQHVAALAVPTDELADIAAAVEPADDARLEALG